jgi:hypothetical protein
MEVDHSQRSHILTTHNKLPWSVMPYPDYDSLTVQYLFRENARRYKNREHLGFRPFDKETKKWVSNFVILLCYMLCRVLIII